jgi:hypothetical protein
MSARITPEEIITNKILFVGGKKVMLDRDLAELYGVTTKALNQAVARNVTRFPEDFMFRLVKREIDELVTNCDRFKLLKHSSSLPYVFTEQGVAMLSGVLNSKRAIEVNIAIMRVFVRLRQVISENKELLKKINQMERKLGKHDEEIQVIFDVIKRLMSVPQKGKKKIGFHVSIKER